MLLMRIQTILAENYTKKVKFIIIDTPSRVTMSTPMHSPSFSLPGRNISYTSFLEVNVNTEVRDPREQERPLGNPHFI